MGWQQTFVNCRLPSGVTFSPSHEEPGHDFQPTTPTEGPWQDTAASESAGVKAIKGRGRALHTGRTAPRVSCAPICQLGLPSLAGSKLPPPGRLQHASLICGQLATTLSWLPVFSCFSTSCPYLQTLRECICRTPFFPALPSGQQRAPPQNRGTREGRGESASPDSGTVQSTNSWVRLCETNVTLAAFLPGELDLICQQWVRG